MQQKKIITLLAQGCSMSMISKLLGIDRRTVKSYVETYKASGKAPSELIKPETDLRVPLRLDEPHKERDNQYELLKQYAKQQINSRRGPGFFIDNLYRDYGIYSYSSVISIRSTPHDPLLLTTLR